MAAVALSVVCFLFLGVPADRDLTNKDKVAADMAVIHAAEQVEQLKMEVDIRIAAFLKEEAISQDKAALFQVMRQEVSIQFIIKVSNCC